MDRRVSVVEEGLRENRKRVDVHEARIQALERSYQQAQRQHETQSQDINALKTAVGDAADS
eukprot:8621338-Karenia_brevis.AAC.1